jgi:Tfp pilus assembly PilM family ATPase
MPRLLAIEWNDTEARLAVASSSPGGAVIEQAFSVALRSHLPGSDGSDVDPGERIGTALAARGIGRVDTLVALGRASIELRQLSVPPAPDEELPDMVRFQALREFNAMEEDWHLDFVPIEGTPGEAQAVLAAAVSPELIQQTQSTCHAAGLKARRIVLRPFGAASLFARSQSETEAAVRLLIDLLGDETDLTVMMDGQVVLLRTARLPGDPLESADAAQALLGEARRTMAAVQNQLGGRRVESVVLCGAAEQHRALAARIQEKVEANTELFDPFGGLTLGRELSKGLPDHPGRFAPLLGILLDELESAPHAMDFLHPRKRPEPASRRNVYASAGLGIAVVVMLGIVFGWMYRNSIKADIKQLSAESTRLEKDVKLANKKIEAAEAIQNWTRQEVVWLDELRWLSEKFPPAEDAMLVKLELSPTREGGKMDMEGLARNVDAIKTMDQDLHDETHQVAGEGEGESRAHERYSARFERAVILGQGDE